MEAQGRLATAKRAQVRLGMDPAGCAAVFYAVKLRLAASAITRVERAMPRLELQLEGVEKRLRQDAPPQPVKINDESVVERAGTVAKLALLHRNILRYGTISKSLAGPVPMQRDLWPRQGRPSVA